MEGASTILTHKKVDSDDGNNSDAEDKDLGRADKRIRHDKDSLGARGSLAVGYCESEAGTQPVKQTSTPSHQYILEEKGAASTTADAAASTTTCTPVASNMSVQNASTSPDTIMRGHEVYAFLQSLPIRDINGPKRNFIQIEDGFPLVLPKEEIIIALIGFLSRIQPDSGQYNKQVHGRTEQAPLMTSGPAGSGKTTFLSIICQLFEHKWNVDSFMESIKSSIDIQSTNERRSKEMELLKSEWLAYLRQTLIEIKSDARVVKLRNNYHLYDNTRPYFVSFGIRTSITFVELQRLGHSPIHILLARIIFSELKDDSFIVDGKDSWQDRYDAFLQVLSSSLLRLPGEITKVITKVRPYYAGDYFMLAVDELVALNHFNLPPPSQVFHHSFVGTRWFTSRFPGSVRGVLYAIRDYVREKPNFFAIVSSLLTCPMEEFSVFKTHNVVIVPLYPLINRIDMLAHIITTNRGAVASFEPVRRTLLHSGGHPKMLAALYQWMWKRRWLACSDMELCREAEVVIDAGCHIFADEIVASGILAGTEVSPDIAARAAAFGGMLTRPRDLSKPSVIIASPLVLYLVAAEHPAVLGRERENYMSVDHLVPSELVCRSRMVFYYFVATWLTARLRLGASLREVIYARGSDEILQDYVGMASTGNVRQFVDKTAFNNALPSSDGLPVLTDLAEHWKVIWDPQKRLPWEYSYLRISIPQIVPHDPAFAIVVRRCSDENTTPGDEPARHRSALIIDCWTQQDIDIYYNKDIKEHATFTSQDFARIIRKNAKNAARFFEAGWTVSLLVLATCDVSSDVVSGCNITEATEPDANVRKLHARSGIIAKDGLRDLFGPSFALALELALDQKYSAHENEFYFGK